MPQNKAELKSEHTAQESASRIRGQSLFLKVISFYLGVNILCTFLRVVEYDLSVL